VPSTKRCEGCFVIANLPLVQLPVQHGLAASGAPGNGAFGCNEPRDESLLKVSTKIRYVFRRPRFPIVCAAADGLVSARSPAAFQRQIERLELESDAVLDIVDATGEGWAFHAELMVVSPLTLKKRWRKLAVIRLYNESQNARRIGSTYPETALSGRSLARIITDVAALAALAKPNMPLQRTAARVAPAPGAGGLDASRVAGAGSRSCR
jgi:hypothetical protein